MKLHLFRLAVPASGVYNFVKTLAWMLTVWTFALVVLPAALYMFESFFPVPRVDIPGQVFAGAFVLVLSSMLGVWCAAVMAFYGSGTPVPFDAARQLVVKGPYRILRNPMAVFGILQTLGVALLVGSPILFLVPVGGALLWQYVIRPSEERFLVATFGEEYLCYQQAVRCWVPSRPYRP